MEYIAGTGEVPLHNVYSALGKNICFREYAFGPSTDSDFFAGWLISVTDPLPPSSPLVHYQDMLERYARLCWTLSSRIGAHTCPKTVHLLLVASFSSSNSKSAGVSPTVNGAFFGTGDLLPAAIATFQCNIPRVEITVTDDAGITSVIEKGPSSRHPQVLAADLYTLKRQHVPVPMGSCDETLEFLLYAGR